MSILVRRLNSVDFLIDWLMLTSDRYLQTHFEIPSVSVAVYVPLITNSVIRDIC